jgi:hypothetical protein
VEIFIKKLLIQEFDRFGKKFEDDLNIIQKLNDEITYMKLAVQNYV